MLEHMMPSTLVPHPATGRHGTAFAPLAIAIAGLLAVAAAGEARAQAAPAQAGPAAGDASASSTPVATPAKRTFFIEPRVTTQVTVTDNARLDNANKKSDVITQLSPGLRMVSEAGRVRGYFDYSLNYLRYASLTEKSTTQNALNTFGTAELVDNWAFVDFNGNISRQAISAFGTQVPDGTGRNANSTEVANYRLSPYVRGLALGQYNYEARYTRSVTRSSSSATSDIDTADASFRLGSGKMTGRLSWSVDLSHQEVDYTLGRDTEADRVRGVLTYTFSPQLNAFLIAGRESNDYASLNKESHSSAGAGVAWALSDRTRFSAEAERRFFARVHKLSFEHRTPRTVWKYTDSKDVTTNSAQGAIGTIGTLYDLFFEQFASIQPDPILRAQMVNAFLQANGLNPSNPSGPGFLSSSVTVQRRQDLSLALLGVRDTLTVLAGRTETRRLQGASAVGDDLSLSPMVEQRNLMVSYSRRLTPLSSLNVIASHQKTTGVAAVQGNTLKSYNVSVSSRLGLKVTGSLGARRAQFDGGVAPYTENAVTGSLNVQF